MAAKSRKQFGFLNKVARGEVHVPGFSQSQAKGMVKDVNYRKLPNTLAKNQRNTD